MAMGNRVGRARFHAIPAENTARVVNVVHAGVTLARGNPVGIGILRGLDVYAICRASGRAEKATHALFQAAFVAMQHMNAAKPRLKMYRLVRIVLRHCFAEHVAESDAETLRQRAEGLSHFANDGGHTLKSNKRMHTRQTRGAHYPRN